MFTQDCKHWTKVLKPQVSCLFAKLECLFFSFVQTIGRCDMNDTTHFLDGVVSIKD